jgi:hypothetical protein
MMLKKAAWTRLLIVGCAQNCEAYLPAVLSNLDRLRQHFLDSKMLVLENDSSDETASLLRGWARSEASISAFSMPGLSQKIISRTERLAHLRNAGLAWFRQQGLLGDASLVLVLDFDEVNSDAWDLDAFINVLDWFASESPAAGVFANQLGLYYDLWALREQKLCPYDIWEAQCELHHERPVLDDQQLLDLVVKPLQFSIDPALEPVKVDSAFGGLGFYKGSWLARLPAAIYVGSRVRWLNGAHGLKLVSWQCSEHVSFNAHLRAAGADLWIHPALVNWDTRHFGASLPFNPSYWRMMQC